MRLLTQKMTRLEWLAWRLRGVGASEAPAVMRKSPWSNPQKLFLQKTGRGEAQEQTYAMARGLALEDLARRAYEARTGISVPKAFAESSEYPVLRASFDGINTELSKVIEIKCPGAIDHAYARHGQIPAHYVWQLVHILAVTKYESIDYVSYDGREVIIVPFKRDLELEKELIKATKAFWKCVLNDTPPKEPKKKPLPKSLQGNRLFKIRRSRGSK